MRTVGGESRKFIVLIKSIALVNSFRIIFSQKELEGSIRNTSLKGLTSYIFCKVSNKTVSPNK